MTVVVNFDNGFQPRAPSQEKAAFQTQQLRIMGEHYHQPSGWSNKQPPVTNRGLFNSID
jgi:hypothetical protein